MSNLIFNMRVWRVHFQIMRDRPFVRIGVNKFTDFKRDPFIAFYW
jgi:hypothetical protein